MKQRVKVESLELKLNQANSLIANARGKLRQIVDFVYSKECRFKFIINYFGEEAENYKCGKCDNCTSKESADEIKSDYLQEIVLKTLIEINKRISSTHLIKVLRGVSKNAVHIKISTFGSCKHFNENELKTALGNLINAGTVKNEKGYLTVPAIENTDKQQPNINSDESVHDYESDLELFNKLRIVRKEASEKFNQPPNMICTDEILREIARQKPKTPSELFSIKNFSVRMFNKTGEDFLAVIKEFQQDKATDKMLSRENLPQNIKQVYELVSKKYLLEDISKLIKLPEAVVSMQIESIIELIPETDIASLIKKDELELINKKISEGVADLKELKNSLPNNISYGKIRIALAKHKQG